MRMFGLTLPERMAAIERARYAAVHGMAKVPKARVEYRDHPNNRESCRLCSMFRKPGSCTYVAGHINPKGWCNAFERLRPTQREK